MADTYKPKFLDTPKHYTQRGRKTAADVGIKPELEALIRSQAGKVNFDDKIGKLLVEEKRLVDRETAYRSLSNSALRSLGIERAISHAETLTFGCLIYLLLKQDVECFQEGGDIASLKTTPKKLTVNEINWSNYMSEKEAKKTTKSRKKAGRSEATQALFMEMAEMYPNFMSMQDDPRYSLSRTKKIDPDILEEAGIKLPSSYGLNNYVFYATEREVEEGEPQEIFFRFMKGKEFTGEDGVPNIAEKFTDGKFTGTSEDCMKYFKRISKELGVPQLDKYYADKQKEAAEAKAAKKAKKADDNDDNAEPTNEGGDAKGNKNKKKKAKKAKK